LSSGSFGEKGVPHAGIKNLGKGGEKKLAPRGWRLEKDSQVSESKKGEQPAGGEEGHAL